MLDRACVITQQGRITGARVAQAYRARQTMTNRRPAPIVGPGRTDSTQHCLTHLTEPPCDQLGALHAEPLHLRQLLD
jgi:hypothetical protein